MDHYSVNSYILYRYNAAVISLGWLAGVPNDQLKDVML
jgi:hypothetical protein